MKYNTVKKNRSLYNGVAQYRTFGGIQFNQRPCSVYFYIYNYICFCRRKIIIEYLQQQIIVASGAIIDRFAILQWTNVILQTGIIFRKCLSAYKVVSQL